MSGRQITKHHLLWYHRALYPHGSSFLLIELRFPAPSRRSLAHNPYISIGGMYQWLGFSVKKGLAYGIVWVLSLSLREGVKAFGDITLCALQLCRWASSTVHAIR